MESWENCLMAEEHGNQCIQYDLNANKVTGSEDCLFLNVYTPIVSVQKVMV